LLKLLGPGERAAGAKVRSEGKSCSDQKFSVFEKFHKPVVLFYVLSKSCSDQKFSISKKFCSFSALRVVHCG
jgi:hypothetical protein